MSSNSICLLIAVLSSLLLTSCAPIAKVIQPSRQITERVCNYEASLDSTSNFSEQETSIVVEGNTRDALVRSLSAMKSGGAPNDFASSRWEVRWDFDWRVASTGCKITSAVAVADIDYRFPVWPRQLTISNRELVSRWTNYSDNLRARHCRYGEFGIQAAVEIEQALNAIAPRRSCNQLEKDANELSRSIVDRYKLLEQKFREQAVVKPL